MLLTTRSSTCSQFLADRQLLWVNPKTKWGLPVECLLRQDRQTHFSSFMSQSPSLFSMLQTSLPRKGPMKTMREANLTLVRAIQFLINCSSGPSPVTTVSTLMLRSKMPSNRKRNRLALSVSSRSCKLSNVKRSLSWRNLTKLVAMCLIVPKKLRIEWYTNKKGLSRQNNLSNCLKESWT